ncbi:DUF2169 family type VI secretion system accessory protein [Polyangium aurulentum]|uniref:DUF2169 family type VI secretion system accessory protein n=1 Tax=Polyangium aurulentum TaxID=2567896 RepID=UPI0010AE3BA8|nr:DUF2169 domain-containing protein [Polyangium aurulentum]UQA62403.1 DUF2169 domain-containing protein [Polyangium aurulentum]
MEVVSVCPFRVASLVWQPRRGGWVLSVVCKATYDLAPVQARLAVEQDEPNEGDNHWDDDPARSIYSPSDLVPFKVRADVVLVGNAFAPRGEPARSIMTRLVVGSIDKSIEAFGERVFGQDGSLREGNRVSKVPLRYERAAGGPETHNPVGVRQDLPPDAYGAAPVPNLQPPGLLVASRADTITPTGYGPIAPTWPSRMEKLGAYASVLGNARWSEHPVPDDIDPSYFNCAPHDQQIDTLRDSERIVLENLHPQHARLVTSLPGLHPRAFILRPGAGAQDLAMKCDTLWIDTDRGQCTVTWRGQIGLDRPNALGRVVVAMEEPGQRLSWSDVERALTASASVQIVDEQTDATSIETLPETPGPAGRRPPPLPPRPGTLPFHPPSDAPAKPTSPGLDALRGMNTSGVRRDESDPSARRSANTGLPFVAPSNAPPVAPAPQAAGLPRPGDASPPWLAGARASQPSLAAASPAVPNATPFMAPAPPVAPMTPQPPPPPVPQMAPQPPPMAPQPAPAPASLPIDSPWASSASRPSGDAIAPPPAVAAGAMAASLAGVGAVAAFTASSQAAPLPPQGVGNAATSGVAAASNAAAAASQWTTPPADTPAVAPAVTPARTTSYRGPTRDVVDLLWFDPKSVSSVRVHPRWKPMLDKLKPEPEDLDLDFDDTPKPKDPPEMVERRDIFAVLTRGETTDAEGIHEAIADAVTDDGTFTPPLVLVVGELQFPFDELETLKATVTAVTPLIAGDKKLKETVDTVNELLKTPWLQSSSGVAEGLTQRVKEAFAQGNRMLPPSYLDTHTERMLLEQRHYQKRTVFGEPWLRSVLVPGGSQTSMPAYLPESLSKKLPMFQRFRARIIAEAHMQQDEYESHPAALKVVAVGRVVSLARRGVGR